MDPRHTLSRINETYTQARIDVRRSGTVPLTQGAKRPIRGRIVVGTDDADLAAMMAPVPGAPTAAPTIMIGPSSFQPITRVIRSQTESSA